MNRRLLERGDCRIDFDQHSAEFARDPIAMLNNARRRCPIGWTDAHGGFWLVTGYDEAYAVLQDDGAFSSDAANGGVSLSVRSKQFGSPPLDVDPPEYAYYRRALAPGTSPGAVAKLREQVEGWTNDAFDAMAGSGSADLIHDLSGPVPAKAVMSLIGLPLDNWRRYSDLYHGSFAHPLDPSYAEHVPHTRAELKETLLERRGCPAGDLVSTLAAGELCRHLQDIGHSDVDGRLVQVMATLLSAGIDTTTNMYANAVIWLSSHPRERDRLVTDPDLLKTATEEFFRYFATAHTLGRTAMRDTDLAGHRIRQGDRVFVSFLGANHDERAFADAGTLLLDRFPNRHMAFGVGLHRCLGSNLARLVFPIMLRQTLERIPDFHIADGAAKPYSDRGTVNGWISVPCTFTPVAVGAGR